MGSVYDMFYSWYVLFKWCYKGNHSCAFLYMLSILLFHPPISSISGGNVHRKDVLGCFRGLVCQPRGKPNVRHSPDSQLFCDVLKPLYFAFIMPQRGDSGDSVLTIWGTICWMLSTPAILISKLDTGTFSIILAARCHRIVASLDPRHRGRLPWRSVGRNLAATATTPGMLWLCWGVDLERWTGGARIKPPIRRICFFWAYPAWPPVNIARW